MREVGHQAFALAKKLKEEAPKRYVPPSEGTRPSNEHILPHAIVRETREYIERVVFQINGCYEKGWFDACAVMMRRLLETLIIECFESHRISGKIKNVNSGDFCPLQELINQLLTENSWNLSRNAKQGIKKLKSVGDQSAHSRRFVAHREDIDKVASDFRTVCQELMYLARLK